MCQSCDFTALNCSDTCYQINSFRLLHVQFTLQAIRRTRETIEVGMTETKVGSILREEFAALGMPDGEGLVLFGGQ